LIDGIRLFVFVVVVESLREESTVVT